MCDPMEEIIKQEENVPRYPSRQKTLTEKGNSLYESCVQKLTAAFDRIWKDIETEIFKFNSKAAELEPHVMQRYQYDVSCLRKEFVASSDNLVEFLIRTNTAESSAVRSKQYFLRGRVLWIGFWQLLLIAFFRPHMIFPNGLLRNPRILVVAARSQQHRRADQVFFLRRK